MPAEQFFARLARHDPAACAVTDGATQLGYAALLERVQDRACALRARGAPVIATQLDNGIDWIVTDLAALHAGCVHVPLPLFFTAAQRDHALRASGAVLQVADGAPDGPESACGPGLPALPPGTAKLTFTSGSTGTPKGVCLDAAALLGVAQGLAAALAPLRLGVHLCALPLPVLLENVAGVYAALLAGATVVAPPLADVGLAGSSSFDPARLDAAVARHRAHSVIALPQMLRAWSAWRAQAAAPATGLRFVAVGGAPVGAAQLQAARATGLPAYEGYGLSEGASVQTLNLPWADRPGSVGRPLPHARVRVSAHGEIEVGGTLMRGYLGGGACGPWWSTGDLGRIDADGFVHVAGRRSNLLITAFGRNVAPEWVETELQAQPAIAHAVVSGNDAPALSAVLWPAAPALPDAALQRAVDAANALLPDYARVGAWQRARAPFDAASGMATHNGRPRRAAIAALHAPAPSSAPVSGAVDVLS